jgi:hypothetical protein
MRTRLIVLLLVAAGLLTSEERRMVKYEIDGTAGYANLTWNNGKGGTEQKQVELPFEDEFSAPVKMLAYVSAQKAMVTRVEHMPTRDLIEILSNGLDGTVHVKLTVNYRTLGEAESDAPFGIAKVESKVE